MKQLNPKKESNARNERNVKAKSSHYRVLDLNCVSVTVHFF